MKEKIQNFKNQNGSITLFVLIACMFFIIVLIGLFISNQNKIQSQAKQIAQIQDTYKVSLNEMDEQYSNISNSGSSNITMEQILNLVYPVGSIYISESSTSPASLFGGTWESYGQGRTLIGAGTGTDSNSVQKTFAANSTGGEYDHTLTTNEMPSHNHVSRMYLNQDLGITKPAQFSYYDYQKNSIFWSPDTLENYNEWNMGNSSYTGGSQSHNNVQPYITVYMWKRTN